MNINMNKQAGLSLIELMIAALLSMLLMIGVVQIFIGSKQTYNTTDHIGRAQENGRFALDVIAQYARMGGYWDYNTADDTPEPFTPLCATAGDPCTQDNDPNGNNNSDRIAIQFDAPDNQDCNGNTPAADRVITNVFWVQNDADGNSSLFCRGFDNSTGNWLGNAQAYISGIDSMQALYGIMDNNGNITNYVNASSVTDWTAVRAIKVAVLAQSGLDTTANFDQRTYVLLDNAPLTFNDGQSRYIFSTTLFINNNEV